MRQKIVGILDNCPPTYEELAEATFPKTDLDCIILNGAGNAATLARQIELLSRQTAAELV